MTILNHVAFILDGNRRWAKERNLPTIDGYKEGAERVKQMVSVAIDLQIPIISMYFFSTENWVRSPLEVAELFLFMKQFLDNYIKTLIADGIRISYLGRLERLPPFLSSAVEDAVRLTAQNNKIVLNIALDYGGRDEIVRAVEKILSTKKEPAQLTEKDFSSFLDTIDLPDPDLVIRTGGEMRISNFLLWQIAYSELYFSEKMWPDFEEKDFVEAVNNYYTRTRRRGGDAQKISRFV